MPAWMQEGNQVLPSSDEMRTLAVWCQLIFNTVGDKPSPFPEGLAPFPGDDEERLTKKINALLS